MRLFARILLGVAALVVLLLVAVAGVVATIDKRALLAPLEARLEKMTGRDIAFGGEPRIDVSLTPKLVLDDVSLANAPWGGKAPMVHAKRIEIELELLPLLSRRLELARFTLVEPRILLETDRNGAGNWVFGAPQAAPAAPTDARAAAGVFALGEFAVERGEVTYRDGRTGETTPVRIEKLVVQGRNAGQPLIAQFKGSVAAVPVQLEGTLGPLAALQAGQWPFPISLKGEVAGRRTEVSTKVEAVPDALHARDLAVTLGESKLAGALAIHERNGRKQYRFDLTAETLALADFALAAASTARPAAPAAKDPHLFPSTPVSFAGLRDVDAQGTLAIRSLVLADGRRFGPLSAKVALDNGRLALDEVAVAIYGGSANGRLTIDAREAVPVLALRLDARELDLAQLMAAAGVQRGIQGAKTDVALDLGMRGVSPRAWAAGVTGTATAKVGAGTIPSGNQGLTASVRQLFDALSPLRESSGRTDLTCAVVRLPLRGGVARIERSIAFETRELGASASGTVDLRNETLDLSFAPRVRAGVALDLSRLAGAVKLRGPIVEPSVAIDPVGAAVAAADARALLRGGPAALLGTRPAAGGGGNECAEALGARPVRESAAAPSQPSPAPVQAQGREVEKSLRKLFGR